jgi:hypothetical protein
MNARTRRKLKKSQFGLPGKRKYPMPDKAHAVNAKARAKQQRKRGKLSKSAYEKVVANANKVIRRSKRKSNHGAAAKHKEVGPSRASTKRDAGVYERRGSA